MINLATGGTRGFTYDASGNVTAEARPGGTYGYTYTAAGRMSEFLINGILQASYKYDAMGRQAIRTLTSPTPVTIHSVFDSDGRRIAEYNETSGALIREYVWNGWGQADQKTLQWSVFPPNARARLRGPGVAVIEGGVISFVRADHIGRPVFATNASGVKTWTATYQPFGDVHTSTGAPPSARFPGQWFQSESGLHQNWMRDYDPTTGRYLQPDPLGLIDGASVYGYVKQSPLMNMDPFGRYAIPFPGGAAGAGRVAMFCFSGLPQLGVCAAGALVIWWAAEQCWDYIWASTPDGGAPGEAGDGQGDDPVGDDNGPPPDPPFDYPHGWDGTTPPAPGWEWRGPGEPGSKEGSWYNPKSKESVRPDFDHPEGIDPHIDYKPRKSPKGYRWLPDGTLEPK